MRVATAVAPTVPVTPGSFGTSSGVRTDCARGSQRRRCSPRFRSAATFPHALHPAQPHRRRADARGGRRRLGRGAVPRHPRRRCAPPARSTCRRVCPSRRCARAWRALAARNSGAQQLSFPRRRRLSALRARRGRQHPAARRVLLGVYAVSAGGEPGHAAGDLRVPDAGRHALRPRGRQRQHVRRRLGDRRGGADGAAHAAEAAARHASRARCIRSTAR